MNENLPVKRGTSEEENYQKEFNYSHQSESLDYSF